MRRSVDAPPDELMARLNRDALVIASRFGLRYRVIEAERPRVKRRYGVCYADGTIRIRLKHAATARPLMYSSLVNTLCHELAHLRHFDHGLRFQRLYREALEYARRLRIYRPGEGRPPHTAPPRPQQLARPMPAAAPLQLERPMPPAVPLQLALFEGDAAPLSRSASRSPRAYSGPR